jgi:plasmid stability protein
VVLEQTLHQALSAYAARHGVSLSQAARDLVRESLEAHEDVALAALGDERVSTLDRRRAASADAVWGSARSATARK